MTLKTTRDPTLPMIPPEEEKDDFDRVTRFRKGQLTTLREMQENVYDDLEGIISGSIPFTDFITKSPWVDVRSFGAKGGGTTDDTQAFKDALVFAKGKILLVPEGVYRITSKISFTTQGSVTILGIGANYNASIVPTLPKGTILLWDGDPADTMFEFGGGPLYIGGVWQNSPNWQLHNTIENFSIHLNKGIKSLFYCHDQDNFIGRKIYINGFNNIAVRGVFDFRGTVSNTKLEHVTIKDVPNAYGVRMGDAFVNAVFDQVIMQKVGLYYWLGDTLVYEDPYASGMTSWRDCTFEGVSGVGKFKVSSISGFHGVGVTSITVTDGSKFAIRDSIFIDRGPDKFEMNRVTNVAGNTLTISNPTEYSHNSEAIIKSGTIGIHSGRSSTIQERTTTIAIRRCMFDRIGCALDLHGTDNIIFDQPVFPGFNERGMFLDGETQNIVLNNPNVWANQNTTWKLFEITDRGLTFNFNWYGAPDKSGLSQPYINNQGDLDANYIGSFQQTQGVSTFPPYFRGITFDSSGGITLRETNGAAGLRYITGDVGSETVAFEVDPSGYLSLNANHGVYLKTTDKLGAENNGTKVVRDSVALVNGVATVTLSDAGIFSGQYSYVVLVSRNANTKGWRVTNNSSSSFTIESSDLADTDTVSFIAIGN